MPEAIRDDLLYSPQGPQATMQYPATAHAGPDGVVANTQQGSYDPAVCPHDVTITNADVEKRWVNPQEPPYFVLNCNVICAHCHTPFEFIHPVRGLMTDQASVSMDMRTVHAPMRPRTRPVPPV